MKKMAFNQIKRSLMLGGIALSLCGIGLAENSQTAQASVQEKVILPKGYNANKLHDYSMGNISRKDRKKLINASIKGMTGNKFYDDDPMDKQIIVKPAHLTYGQRKELAKYSLKVINSARHQIGHKNWVYSKGAMKFAQRVAYYYKKDNASCWDAGHDLHALRLAAKYSGLQYKMNGNWYEDEAGLPITSEFSGSTRSMYALKKQVYFNIKQMLFGGFFGRSDQMTDPSRYTEYEHAGDLLGARGPYDAKYKYYGISFSDTQKHPDRISVHMLSVDKRMIRNYKQFNR